MQLKATFLAVMALVISSVSAAAVTPRIPLVAIFYASPTWGCPLQNQQFFQYAEGSEGPICRNWANSGTMQAVSLQYIDPKCQWTLYNSLDCSDPGIVSGTGGCWSPPGGVKGFKITCPWRNT